MKDLISSPQNIVVIGDMYVSTDVMVESLEKSKINCGKITQLFWGDYDKTHFAENQQNLAEESQPLPDHLVYNVFFRMGQKPHQPFLNHAPLLPVPAPSAGTSSPGFRVLTRTKKYRRWQTHTTAMQILPMGAFFIQRKPIAMTAVTIAMILHFVPAVMAFF